MFTPPWQRLNFNLGELGGEGKGAEGRRKLKVSFAGIFQIYLSAETGPGLRSCRRISDFIFNFVLFFFLLFVGFFPPDNPSNTLFNRDLLPQSHLHGRVGAGGKIENSCRELLGSNPPNIPDFGVYFGFEM